MKARVLNWLGSGRTGHVDGQPHGDAKGHGHTHGVVDPALTTSDRGVWALKWSFIILAVTAALQLSVVFVSGSVALLADTIHNIGDATTAIPLWFAFILARRKPSATFTYGLGRVEDLAGILIVLIILLSALVAGYEAIDRLIHPQAVTQLGWVIAAGIVGFVGNEVVAIFRIRVGRQMNSAALIADGYHARTDGLTSLAVVLGAVGVWFGYPLADPIIGLLITIAIFGIVWQSARAVVTRTLDGVEPRITAEIRHAAGHVPALRVRAVKARWIGHKLHADIEIDFDDAVPYAQAKGASDTLRHELLSHLPELRTVNIAFGSEQDNSTGGGAAAHRPPEPFAFDVDLAAGVLEIVDTPEGERMRLNLRRRSPGLTAHVVIERSGANVERLELAAGPDSLNTLQSSAAPAEPHEFSAALHLAAGERTAVLPFKMSEPAGHHR